MKLAESGDVNVKREMDIADYDRNYGMQWKVK